MTITITLNGEPYDTDQGSSLTDLLTRLQIDPRRVAVEHNFVVVKRDAYASTFLADGDQVEIVNFVGGGSGIGPSGDRVIG
jgi:thiamine biosynthesis protein ThiS